MPVGHLQPVMMQTHHWMLLPRDDQNDNGAPGVVAPVPLVPLLPRLLRMGLLALLACPLVPLLDAVHLHDAANASVSPGVVVGIQDARMLQRLLVFAQDSHSLPGTTARPLPQ